MPVRDILHLGNPGLRTMCSPIRVFGIPALYALARDLGDTLDDFRRMHGFGRGIAAPQLGASHRMIVLHVDDPLVLLNPVIIRRSRKVMTLWDDCFSFPDLVAKVKRNLAIEVRFQDLEGKKHTIPAEGPMAELLQHEVDHLDGVLALDRAIDSRHIMYKTEYERWVVAHGSPMTL
jgi:peptide deformylase